MKIEILVDSDSFWSRLQKDIASAEKNVYIQTLSFEGDSTGQMLADRMISCAAPDKRIVIDCFTKYILSDKFRFSPKNLFDFDLRRERKETSRMVARLLSDGTRIKFVNPVGLLLCRFPFRNHKKIISIDNRISYIGGINFSDHNFLWHDMMLRIEDDDVTAFLSEDFLTSWAGRHFCGRRKFDQLELFSFDGKNNEEAFVPIFDIMAGAKKSIYVQSPYLSFPFCDHLREASGRKVKVTIVTPEQNNRKQIQQYIHWESARGGFDLRLYPGRLTHLKAMLIDDTHLIVGSANFDNFTYRFAQETLAVITDPAVIAEFTEKVIDVDSRICRQADTESARVSGYLRNLQLKSIDRVSTLFK